MNPAEVDAWVAGCCEAYNAKQRALTEEFKIGANVYARWLYDQPTATLKFFEANGRAAVIAGVVDIGSYSKATKSWRWTWANESNVLALRAESERLCKQLHERTGLALFTTPTFELPHDRAPQLLAMAVEVLAAKGGYRAPAGHLETFLVLTTVSFDASRLLL